MTTPPGLQPRRQVGGLADHGIGLCGATDLAHYRETGCDADAGAQGCTSALQRGHCLGYFQTGTHRPFGIVFMSVGKAEIGQHAVAQIFREEAIEPSDHVGDASVIGCDDLAELFRVEARCQHRRVDEVAEHNR